LPSYIKENLIAYVACLAGAVTEDDYKTFLADAHFHGETRSTWDLEKEINFSGIDVHIVDNKHDLNVYLQADDTNAASSTASCIVTPAGMNTLPPDYDANEWAGM
jgi:hypothetical protein